jgi:hypothetical protein
MISVGTITSIAQFLRMPISFFLEDAALPFDMLTNSSKRVALLDAYDKLDAPSRDLLISIAKSLGEARDEHRLAAE